MSTENEIIIAPQIKPYKGGYNDKFIHKVLNHMKTGKSLHSFAGSIGVSMSTVNKWVEEYPKFAEAVEIAKSINLGTLEQYAIEQVTGDSKGSSSMLTFLMKNQHHDQYKDKQVVENEGGVVYQINTGVPRQLEDKPIETTAEVVDNDIEDAETLEDEDLL